MNPEDFDRELKRLLDSEPPPPPAPRELMWRRIREARERAPGRPGQGNRPWWRTSWPIGIAALLALGFALGRITSSRTAPPVTPASTVARPGGAGNALQVSTVEHLAHAEMFLTAMRADAIAGRSEAEFRRSARDLLATTRLLLDAPQLQDPHARILLVDLELALAQILQENGPDSALSSLFREFDNRGLLPRLRAAIPAGGNMTVQGEL